MPHVSSRTRSTPARAPAAARRGTALLLLVEGASFVAASMIHRGVLVAGYAHAKAAVAESVIGAVLLAGLAVVLAAPAAARVAALATQAFALLGTLVGLLTVAIGVGPRTAPDLAYHVAILALLAYGVVRTARGPTRAPPGREAHQPG